MLVARHIHNECLISSLMNKAEKQMRDHVNKVKQDLGHFNVV